MILQIDFTVRPTSALRARALRNSPMIQQRRAAKVSTFGDTDCVSRFVVRAAAVGRAGACSRKIAFFQPKNRFYR